MRARSFGTEIPQDDVNSGVTIKIEKDETAPKGVLIWHLIRDIR
jgi:hypothetical protein